MSSETSPRMTSFYCGMKESAKNHQPLAFKADLICMKLFLPRSKRGCHGLGVGILLAVLRGHDEAFHRLTTNLQDKGDPLPGESRISCLAGSAQVAVQAPCKPPLPSFCGWRFWRRFALERFKNLFKRTVLRGRRAEEYQKTPKDVA